MAWDGTIHQDVFSVHGEPFGGCTVTLRCGHMLYSILKPHKYLKTFRRVPCPECSEAHKARIAEIRKLLDIDEVIRRIKGVSKHTIV